MRNALGLVALLGGCQLAFGLDPVSSRADGGGATDARAMPGVVAHYAMDALPDKSATCLIDDSGHGRDGICYGDAPTVVPGRIGSAFQLAGMSRIQIATATPLAGPGAFTIAGWIYPTGPLTDGMCPFNRPVGNASEDSWQVCLSDTSIAFYLQGGDPIMFAQPPQAKHWYHLAIASTGTDVTAFVNGTAVATISATPTFDSSAIQLGTDVDAGGTPAAPVVGAIDDVWIFDRVLTAAEIDSLETP